MAYILRERNDEDKNFFVQSGARNPFGGNFGFSLYLVENSEEDVKMIFIGGQGNMTEDGTEWSDMARYSLVVWQGRWYIVEFFYHKQFIQQSSGDEKVIITYKIKEIHTMKLNKDEKEKVLDIIKKCFIAYGNGGINSTPCEKIEFIDEGVKWD